MGSEGFSMKTTSFRAPAYPLVTIDPYTSLWSMADILTNDTVRHWSGKPNAVIGLAEIDGKYWRFMGVDDKELTPAMQQTDVAFDSFSTTYTFEAAGVGLQVRFTSPLLPTDRLLCPVRFPIYRHPYNLWMAVGIPCRSLSRCQVSFAWTRGIAVQ